MSETINDLLDLTLREILDKYCAILNLECGYYYGIFKFEDVDQIYEEFNVEEDYPDGFCVESIVNDELVVDFDESVKDYDTLLRIMSNLGVSRKDVNK